MKTLLLTLLLASSAFAQDLSAITAAEAACGPRDVQYDVKTDNNQHPMPVPVTDKALVYVAQEFGEIPCKSCALTKVGVDGAWVGANKGSSYFFFSVDPGEHHVCLNWQSRFEQRSRAVALANFIAEAGRVYYFRARIFSPGIKDIGYSFDLDPINSDQGKLLVASSRFSISHPKQ
jgi:hypothetical protein